MNNSKKGIKLTTIGFTLVELLAVIVILGVILAIAVPNVLTLINQSRVQAFERQRELIVDAARKYVAQNAGIIVWTGSTTEVSLRTLQDVNLLPNPLSDPRGGVFNNHATTGTRVTVTRTGDIFAYSITVVSGNDSTPPVITLTGASTLTIPQNSTYTDAGATASDDVDGNITARITVVNSVNTATIGTYTVRYNVSDNAGNAATQITRTVNVIASVYTFTNCTQTGRLGPSQAQCNSAYTGTSLAGLVTVTGGIQHYTIPTNGTYRIEVWGAQGGSSHDGVTAYVGGLGARMRGDFVFTSGTQIKILVGQRGEDNPNFKAAGGGGGTFVTNMSNVPFIVAGGGGGGGGNSNPGNGHPGLITTTAGAGSGGFAPGTNGSGGGAPSATGSGGGGGLTGNGSFGWENTPGISFVNGGSGGLRGSCAASTNGGHGGFGGGAGGEWCQMGAAGAGGGFSGGAGTSSSGVPGGGGSINNGTIPSNSDGVRTGHGQIIITFLNP